MGQCKTTLEDCQGCCNCCKYTIENVRTGREEHEEFYEVRMAFKIERPEIGVTTYYCYTPCPQLDKETGACKIYDKRPKTCRLFPGPGKKYTGWSDICKVIQKMEKPKEQEIEPVFKALKIIKT